MRRRRSRMALLLATARHLGVSQIAARLRALARRRWRRMAKTHAPRPAGVRIAAHQPLWLGLTRSRQPLSILPKAAELLAGAREIVAGRFTFLGRTVDYSQGVRWNDPAESQLWRYHLHYFDYVRELALLAASGERAAAFAAVRRLIRSWVAGNETVSGDGWRAYTVSLRLVNWCHALDVFADELRADPAFAEEMASSLYGQARYLADNIEHDVRGNHILKNLRALLWAGVVFEGDEARGWLRDALALLAAETREQVLPDGGHFERVPGYHRQVLADLFEITLFLRRNDRGLDWIDAAVERMFAWLDAVVPPSGRLPLLKDTALELEPTVEELRDAAGAGQTLYALVLDSSGPERTTPSPHGTRWLSDSGYVVVRDDARGEHLIVDVGQVCPDYLPAHAHADALSFELTVDGRPVIVDAGIYEYRAGEWRDHFRSTAAHNTVQVSGANQSEVWGSFRVGQRARVSHVTVVERDGVSTIAAEHDGYQRLIPPSIHRRIVTVRHHPSSWTIADELLGDGSTGATSRLRLHPSLTFVKVGEARWSIVGTPLIVTLHGATARLESGWYSERFGEKEETQVLALDLAGPLPLRFGYTIQYRSEYSSEKTTTA